jgi:hypothetical protein
MLLRKHRSRSHLLAGQICANGLEGRMDMKSMQRPDDAEYVFLLSGQWLQGV